MEQLSLVPIALSLFGGVYDIATKRIPNWLNFSGIAIGILTHVYLSGSAGALFSGLGLLAGFALFFPLYFFGIMGAGDVKLLMLVGAWVGPPQCLEAALAAIVLGGAYALINTLVRGRLYIVAHAIFRYLRSLLVPVLEVESLQVDKKHKFSFGPCIALGLLCVTLLHEWGRL